MDSSSEVMAAALSAPPGETPPKARSAAFAVRLEGPAHTLLARFAGPAFLGDARGRIIAANEEARPVAEAVASGLLVRLSELVLRAAIDGLPVSDRVSLPGAAGGKSYDATVLPLAPAGEERARAIGFLRDVTLERNLILALGRSRTLYKDLVVCASDFAWETDDGGAFTFVSPKGVLGYGPSELNGLRARGIFETVESADGAWPFEAREVIENAEYWFRDISGAPRCLLVSAIPAMAKDGSFLGTRGVARDVTEDRLRERELARARDRERLLNEVFTAMRAEVDPRRTLDQTLSAIAGAISADEVYVLARQEGVWAPVAETGFRPERESAAAPGGIFDRALAVLEAEGEGTTGGEVASDGEGGLVALARNGGAADGALVVRRHAAVGWDEDERALVRAVADQIGVILAQIADRDALARLARTDPVTGLPNRRALADSLEPRFSRGGAGAAGALLCLDLDGFKDVNDEAGHEAGDRVLVAVADYLRRHLRESDLAIRVGGDEFAIWLEGADPATARGLATRLIRAMPGMVEKAARRAALSASVGIAIREARTGETLEDLMRRSDHAMYAAKRAGKGRAVFARAAPC